MIVIVSVTISDHIRTFTLESPNPTQAVCDLGEIMNHGTGHPDSKSLLLDSRAMPLSLHRPE